MRTSLGWGVACEVGNFEKLCRNAPQFEMKSWLGDAELYPIGSMGLVYLPTNSP